MHQLLDACNRWTDAVVKSDSIIEPLPWPFCPIEGEDEVMEETEDEDAVLEETKDDGTGTSETAKGQDSTATNEFKLRLVDIGKCSTLKAVWGNDSACKIIERKSYVNLWSQIRCLFQMEGRKTVLLLGNPGVGKTGFLLYILLMLLKEKKTILLQSRGGDLLFFKYEGHQYLFSRPRYLHATDLFVDEEIHYLVDGKLPDVPIYVGKALLACTPLKSNYKDYAKDAGCKTFYLPVWSASEMSLLRQEVFSELPKELLEERYTQWGGIPRFVLEFRHLEISKLINKLPDLQDLVLAVARQTADEDHPSHKVIHVKVTANYQNFELMYASPYVQDKVFKMVYEQGRDTLKSYLAFSGGALLGFSQLKGGILELFFKRVATQKASFAVMEVSETKGRGEEEKIEFEFGEPKDVKNLNDIDPAKDQDRIIWPLKTNLETVDSFVLRKQTDGSYILQAFQVTLSSRKGDHGLKYAGMLDLMNRFKIAADKVEFYMVTTEERFKESGYQSWRTKNNSVLQAQHILRKMEGIRQFALNCGGK